MEDFVTFEIAKKLKEKGFIGNGEIGCCCGFYCEEGFAINIVYDDLDNSELLCNEYLRPSISQVLKWLREEKNMHLIVEIADSGWYYTLYPNVRWEDGKLKSDKYIMSFKNKNSYEEATLNGIEYVLDKLI